MSTVLIIGSNRGIGLERCRQLKARGEKVTAVCRTASVELASLGLNVIDGIDVADESSVRQLAESVIGMQFDWLINNAGILGREGLEDLDFESIEQQFRVNSMGPLRVTHALIPNLTQGSKVGIVTSRMGSVDDNSSGGYYGYRMSKAAVNMAGVCLARDLEQKGVAVGLLHPGMVSTDMTANNGVPVSKSAAGLIRRMDELNLQNTGSFWHAEGEMLPW